MGCRGTQGAEVALPRGRAQEGLIHAAALAQAAVEADISGHSPAARPLCPEAERAGPRRRCGEGTGVWVSFCSAVYCLVRKRVVGFCLKMLNSRLPWFSQAFSFLGSSGNLPRGSAMASPPPQGVLVLGARAPRQTGASLCGKRRGREGSCRRPSHRGSGLCTPVAGGRLPPRGRPPPRGPEAVASCRPSPCSPRSAVCRPCRASCLSPRLPSASSPVAQTGPSGGDCGFRPGGPAVSRGPRLSASPRVATARAARLGGGKAAG